MSSPPQDTPSTSRSPSAQSQPEDPIDPPPTLAPELGRWDLILHCHDNIWYLHRATLCTKSGYIRKSERLEGPDSVCQRTRSTFACGQLIREQDHTVVDVEEILNPHIVWTVVLWCYHERIDLNTIYPHQATLSAAAQEEARLKGSMLLWAAAEQLEVVGLKEALWMQAYSSVFFFEPPGPAGVVPIAAVIRVIRAVYDYTPEPLTLALKVVHGMGVETDTPELAAQAFARHIYGHGYERLYRRQAMRARHLLFRWLSMHFDVLGIWCLIHDHEGCSISTFVRDFDQLKIGERIGKGKCPFCKTEWALDLQSARISEKCSTCGARSTVDEWVYHEDILFLND
ncbi:hypothetical protein HDK90DRAFT_541220 [Phyllosticta capitalensis]|uniref:BTB domain-containing protein n=1 Tax=Phyllosticta capitalensis TaxID=121624 RepID=A0ABR1YEH0_9PEZI